MAKTKAELEQDIQKLKMQVSNANDALEASLAASPITDNNFFPAGMSDLYEGRTSWDRNKIFNESLRAWRVNPIARRIVKLMTSFIVGKGLVIKSDNEQIQSFLTEWWEHPKNNFDRNVKRWKDEDTRTGNLFPLFNVLPDGMTIVRMIPAEQIREIKTNENDAETKTAFVLERTDNKTYPPYNPDQEQQTFMLHFPSNQPVGSPWGEADLSPLLVWIGRFSSWLEDRVRLNRFRTAFMYVISGHYNSEEERRTRQIELNANPPKSGSTLVINANNGEQWGILSAQLDSFDASVDGLAIKKMIAAGVGFPMHYLAEPEGATQTTAEAAGTPTFRTLEEAQNDFFEMLIEMAKVATQIKDIYEPTATIWIEGPDITERDNATLALALGRAYPPLSDMFDRGAIDEKELMRLLYKNIAEVFDGKTPTIEKKPLFIKQEGQAVEDASSDPSDPSDPKGDE